MRQPRLQKLPFLRGDHARHRIEGKDPLRALVVVIDVERDALAHEIQLAGRFPGQKLLVAELLEFPVQRLAMPSHLPIGGEHLVVKLVSRVAFEHRILGFVVTHQ